MPPIIPDTKNSYLGVVFFVTFLLTDYTIGIHHNECPPFWENMFASLFPMEVKIQAISEKEHVSAKQKSLH